MPISVIKGNFYDGPIDSFLTLFVDPYYYNSYSGSGTTVIDLSGDNDGTLNNVTFDVEQGGSFVFSNNSYIDFLNNQDYYSTGDLTICALVKPTQDNMGNEGGPIISVDSFTNGSNYLALVYGTSTYPGRFSWIQRSGTGGSLNIPTNTICPSNDWYFVSITRSESTGKTKIYINGVLDRENDSGTTLPTYNLRVGRNKVKNPSGQFLGKISSIRIFIRELTQSEIVNIYNNLRLPPKTLGNSNYSYEPSQNLMVYSNRSLHVDAGEPNSYYIRGNTFSDLTGRGINGTLTNSFSGTNPTFSQFNGGYFNFNGFKTSIITNPDQTGNSFIEFNAEQLPTTNKPSTIITWARCSGYTRTNRYIFSYGSPVPNQSRYLGVSTLLGKFIVGGGASSELVSNSSVILDKWFQLTFVYTGSDILIYVNGVVDGSLTRSLTTFVIGQKARIGRQITVDGGSVANADGYWFGDISEVIVYDRVLDPQEIYQDYKVKRYRYGLGEVTRPTGGASGLTVPIVVTIEISGINTTTAQSGVQIVSNGNSNITASGIIWSTSSTNLISLGTQVTGLGNINITGLSPGVTYYVVAYATNAVGTSYGDILSFISTPIVLPNVIAITASYTGNSAFATGSVTGLGNATFVSARGFVWSTSPIDQNTAGTITTTRVTESGSFVTGDYGLSISPLNADTTYYVRAFATNTATTAGTTNTPGTTYSSTQLVFRTYAFATVTITSIPSASITGTSFFVNITTTGQLITEQGVIWKTVNSIPNISSDLNVRQFGSAGAYSFTINSPVNPGTTYYVYGYVKNAAGIAYSTPVQTVVTDNFPVLTTDDVSSSNITNTTATVSGSLDNISGSTVTQLGFIWTDDSSFFDFGLDIDNKIGVYTKTIGITTGPYSHKITGLSELTNYYVRAYALNSVGYGYGDPKPFTTFGTPIVTVSTPSLPTLIPDQYILNGSILSLGGYSPVEVGFEYFITTPPGVVTTVISIAALTTTGVFGKKVILVPNTNYSVRSYVKYPLGTIYSGALLFTTQAGLPSVITTPISTQTSTSANSGGDVTSDGGSPVTARGLVYNTSPIPTTANPSIPGGAGNGTFISNITGLTPGTTYYVRAYATNAIGTQYGNEVTFTTSASTTATVTATTTPTSPGQNTATSGGNISSDGGSPVTARGVVWSTSTNPQLPSTFKTIDGTGPGTFTSNITGLLPKTTYYVRAYATNVNGTVYGPQISFITIDVPELTTTAISAPTNNSAQSGGSISTDNGSAIIAKGVVWSTLANPTILLTTKTSNGTGTGNFTSTLTLLTPSTTYYVRAYATNGAGTGYGNQVTFTTTAGPTVNTNITTLNITNNSAQSGGTVLADGGATVTARGVVWSTSQNPTILLPTKTSDGTGTGAFTSAITGLAGNTTYYVRAYATNANGTSYGTQESFVTFLITTGTIQAQDIFSNKVNVVGSSNIIWTTPAITARGVVWSTSQNPTILLTTKTLDGTGAGTFDSPNVQVLSQTTTYYIRAYATITGGTTYYGDEKTFTTPVHPLIFNTTLSSVPYQDTYITSNIRENKINNYSQFVPGVGGGSGYSNYQDFKIAFDGPTSRLSNIWRFGYVRTTAQPASVGDLTITTPGTVNSTNPLSFVSRLSSEPNNIYNGPFNSINGNLNAAPARTWYLRSYITDTLSGGSNIVYSNVINVVHVPIIQSDFTIQTDQGTITIEFKLVTMRPTDSPSPVVNNYGVTYFPMANESDVSSSGPYYNISFNQPPTLNVQNIVNIVQDIRLIPVNSWYSIMGWVEYTSVDGTMRIHGQRTARQRPAVELISAQINGITTGSVNSITTSGATITGSNITNNGGGTITARGVCWSTLTTPTIGNSKTNDFVSDATARGSFDSVITGLSSGTYYVRAYATNEAGTSYGNQVSFTTTLPSISTFDYNTSYIVTSNGPSNLSGEIRFDMTVTNGINLIPGIEQSLFSNFSTVERSSDGNIISSSPATVTVSGFGDFATLALPNEIRYYRGYVKNADSSIKVYTPNPVRSFQFEDIRLTSLTYDAANNRFVAVIQFNATSGLLVAFIGIVTRKDSIDPASTPFGNNTTNASSITSATNTYTVTQPATSYLSGETMRARAFVQINGSRRQFSFDMRTATKT